MAGVPVRSCGRCGCEVVVAPEAREFFARAFKVQAVRDRAGEIAAELGAPELSQVLWEPDAWRRIFPAIVAGVLAAVSESDHALAERGL